MGLSSIFSSRRRSRDPQIYYYAPPDSIGSINNHYAAYQAANSATSLGSRSNSMMDSSAAAAAALRYNSINQQVNAGRTMSLTSPSLRRPPSVARRRSSLSQRTMSLQSDYNPVLRRQLSGLRRVKPSATTTTTTTTEETTDSSGIQHQKIIKTTKDFDTDGHLKSITRRTIETKGELEVVRTTIVRPARGTATRFIRDRTYATSLLSRDQENDLANIEEEFDEDFTHDAAISSQQSSSQFSAKKESTGSPSSSVNGSDVTKNKFSEPTGHAYRSLAPHSAVRHLTSTSSSPKKSILKHVEVSTLPSEPVEDVIPEDSYSEEVAEPVNKKMTPEEMYAQAFKVAQKKVYHSPSMDQRSIQSASRLDQATKRNTLLNTGDVTSLSSAEPIYGNQSQYHPTNRGFRTYSLRELPDSKKMKNWRKKRAKQEAKEEHRIEKMNQERQQMIKETEERLLKEQEKNTIKIDQDVSKSHKRGLGIFHHKKKGSVEIYDKENYQPNGNPDLVNESTKSDDIATDTRPPVVSVEAAEDTHAPEENVEHATSPEIGIKMTQKISNDDMDDKKKFGKKFMKFFNLS